MSTVYPTSLERKLPYITVSGKGISNGLSSIPNDGADFGPDTMLNATAPNQYGPPYTQTSGIQEALNYASQVYQSSQLPNNVGYLDILIKGWANVYTDIIAPSVINHVRIFGTGRGSSIINFMKGSRGFVLDNTNVYFFNHLAFMSVDPITPPQSLIAFSDSSINYNQAMWFRDCTFYANQSTTYAFNVENAYYVHINDSSIDMNFGYFYASSTTPNPTTEFKMTNTIGSAQSVSIDGFDLLELIGNYSFALHAIGNNNHVNIISGEYVNSIQLLRSTPSGATSAAKIGRLLVKDVTIMNTISSVSNPTLVGANGAGDQSTVDVLEVDGLIYEDVDNGSSTGTIYPVAFSNYPPNSGGFGCQVTQKVKIGSVIALDGLPVYTFDQLPPSLSANPPASGTVYQNTNPFDIELIIPVTLNPTSSASATATLAIGPSSSSLSTVDTETAPAGLTAGVVKALKAKIPAGWYYELTLTNATAATATAMAA